ERQDPAAIAPLEALAASSKLPQGRMQALYALAGQKALTAPALIARLKDEYPRVREHAARLAEPLTKSSPELCTALVALADDPDLRVRYQLAFSLGSFEEPARQRDAALAQILLQNPADKWIRLAVFSSLAARAGDVFALAASNPKTSGNDDAR